jgi:catecholate siderophore receptor
MKTFPFPRRIRSIVALANAIILAGSAKAADRATPEPTPVNKADAKPTPTGTASTTTAARTTAATPAKGSTATTSGNGKLLNTIVVTAAKETSYQGSQASLPYYTEPLVDTPQTITVIPQQVIKDQNATTLRDILRNVPGISFQAGEGSSTVGGDNLSIRGFNARDDMFIDGIRDTGVYTRDPFNTEQVEVVKGPASAYEGYGETGGSVNLISKTPFLQPMYEVDGGYGTNAYNRESADINQPITEFGDCGMALRLDGFQQYNEVANRNFVYDNRWGFAPSLAIGLGTSTRVTLSYLHQREDDLPDYGFPFVNAAAVARGDFPVSQLNQVAPLPYNNWYGNLNHDHETAVTDIPTLTIDHDFDNGVTIKNQTRFDRTNYLAFNTSARFDTTPPLLPGTITREATARNDTDELTDNKTFVTIPFTLWNIPNTLVNSLEYSHENDTFKTATGPNNDTNLANPDPFASYPLPLTWIDPQKNILEDVAWSVFDTVKFTPQWELNGGMRYDHLDESFSDVGPKAPSYFHRTDDLASWRLALVYKPAKNGSIYAGYGTSYNPSIQGTADGASNEALAANTVNLAPEEDKAFEVGSKWDVLDEKLSLNLAVFRTDKSNSRVTDPTQPGTVYVLQGIERVQGVEFDVAGDLTRDWHVFGGYVYMKGKVEDGPSTSFPGHTLPNTPDQSASFWTTYDLPCNVTIGTGAVFVDQRYALVNELNSVPDYWTQSAMVRYQVNKNVDVQINASNLWDKHFIDLVGAHQAVPGAGRTVIFSTTVKF